MQKGKHMAKQLDCTLSIASTQNNGIHGIYFGPHMTFSRLSHLASKWKPGLINISGVDWKTSKLNHSNQQVHNKSSSQNWISDSTMIVQLMMTHISSEYYTTGIFSNEFTSWAHLALQTHPNFEQVRLADARGRQIYGGMNAGDRWLDTHDQLPTGATIVPVRCLSNKTLLTTFPGN